MLYLYVIYKKPHITILISAKMSRSNFFNRKYLQLLKEEPDLITRTRIRILSISILSFISLFLILFVLYVFKAQNLLLLRMGLLLSLLIVVFVALMKWPESPKVKVEFN